MSNIIEVHPEGSYDFIIDFSGIGKSEGANKEGLKDGSCLILSNRPNNELTLKCQS